MRYLEPVSRTPFLLIVVVWVFVTAHSCLAQQQKDLAEASLEDLTSLRVTSVTRTERALSRTASSVFVITSEDIRQSGLTSIAEVLRMVPGMNVARIGGSTWAISARGFNGRFADKLLVLVDGRPVYTPTFGGVFWDVLDMPLEDVSQIEVIRGPGGSVWGANAVNGVISIVTRNAHDTQGTLLSANVGTSDQVGTTIQYGGQMRRSTAFRVYSKYLNYGHTPGLTGPDAGDAWHALRGGFRTDTDVTSKDSLTLQGDLYGGSLSDPAWILPFITSTSREEANDLVALSGGFLQGIWNHSQSMRSDTTLRTSFTRYKRLDILGERRNTLHLDFQHHYRFGERHDIVWGAAYRYSSSHSHGSLTFSVNTPRLDTHEMSSFVQDEIALYPDRLYVTVGTKLDQDHYSGFNVMPSARVVWTPTPNHAIWGAASHAVSTPSMVDISSRTNIAGVTLTDGSLGMIAILGNPNFANQGMNAYELGYRSKITHRLSMDVSAYFNTYSSAQTVEPGVPFMEFSPSPPHLVIPYVYQNLMHGTSQGLEVSANWHPVEHWTLTPGYSFETIHLHTSRASNDTQSIVWGEHGTPTHSAQLRSSVSLKRLTWDTSVYFVDRLLAGNVPSYTRIDSQLTWRWQEGVSIGVVGQNLLRDRHLEYLDGIGSIRPAQVKRSAYLKITWSF